MAALLSRASLIRLSLLAGCLAVAPGAIPAAAETDPPAGFETRILPILQAKCLACHGPQNQEKELDLGSRQSLLRGGASGPSVVPGSAERSLLFQKVETGEMPLGQDPLSPGELDSIRRWIDQGALADGQDPAAFQARNDLKPAVTSHEVLVPILHVRCLICHGRRKQEAGLDLRTRASILKGGKSGAAMVPASPKRACCCSASRPRRCLLPSPFPSTAFAPSPRTNWRHCAAGSLRELRKPRETRPREPPRGPRTRKKPRHSGPFSHPEAPPSPGLPKAPW